MIANLSIINIIPNRFDDIYIKLENITLKLHNMSVIIAYVKKVSFVYMKPKFAIVKTTIHY